MEKDSQIYFALYNIVLTFGWGPDMTFSNFVMSKLESVGLSEIAIELFHYSTIFYKKTSTKRHQEIQSHLKDCR